MAARMVGNQAVFRNQTTVPAESNATVQRRRKIRAKCALANAATPRGVRGCHAAGGVGDSEVELDSVASLNGPFVMRGSFAQSSRRRLRFGRRRLVGIGLLRHNKD